ncbi:MAG: astA, partial [Chlamydiia bacterium]|nr:astA [Chlamydiia bacterium]
DLPELIELSTFASLGFTTFPKDPDLLEQKIMHSIASFEKNVEVPANECYLFALDDTQRKKIIGISAIFATTGGGGPLYFFRKESTSSNPFSTLPHIVQEIPILSPISYLHGPSELCSLFLHPEARAHGLGRLLSLGRLLFVAKHEKRFTNSFFAELRGFIENDTSPFWDSVGRHFFDIPFRKALELLQHGKSFISHFLPKYPIYIPLLPKAVQDVIGKTHPHTIPALNLLLQQGFQVTQEVDIFDAGPKLRAVKNEITTIQKSKVYEIIEVTDTSGEQEPTHLLSNDRIEFRACLGRISPTASNQIAITSEIAKSLQVGFGDRIRGIEL